MEGSATVTEHATTDHPVSTPPESSDPAANLSAVQPAPQVEEPPVAWYDIHIGNQQFTIASRKGEEHVRSVEKLIGETVRKMDGLLDGQGPANTALLIALNLADQLQAIRSTEKQNGADDADRLRSLVGKLASTLDNPSNTVEHKIGEHTSAVYEKLEFF